MIFQKRVLLLGGEPHILQLVRQTLETVGRYLLKEEQNFRAAVQTIRLFKPEVIFFTLGGADGPGWNEALQAIRQDRILRTMPVFTLASIGTGDSVTYSGSLNGYDFSIQPVGIDELVRSVDQMLGR